MNSNDLLFYNLFQKYDEIKTTKQNMAKNSNYKDVVRLLICHAAISLIALTFVLLGVFSYVGSSDIDTYLILSGLSLFFCNFMFVYEFRKKLFITKEYKNIVFKYLLHPEFKNLFTTLFILFSVIHLFLSALGFEFFSFIYMSVTLFYGVNLIYDFFEIYKSFAILFKNKNKKEQDFDMEILDIEHKISNEIKDSIEVLEVNEIYCKSKNLTHSLCLLKFLSNMIVRKKGFSSYEDYKFKKAIRNVELKKEKRLIQNF